VIKTVMFDLFGTLLTYDHGRLNKQYPDTWHLAETLGFPGGPADFIQGLDHSFSGFERQALIDPNEYSMLDVVADCFDSHNINLTSVDRFLIADSYCFEWSADIVPVPGLAPFLSRLAKQYQLAIITNTHHAPMVNHLLEVFEIKKTMSLVVTSIEHGKAKPHPSIFEAALAQLNCTAGQAVFIGDSYEADYLGATAIGIEAFLIGSSARVPIMNQILTVVDLPRHRI